MIENKIAIVWKNGSTISGRRIYLPAMEKIINEISADNVTYETVLSWCEFKSKIIQQFSQLDAWPYSKIILLVELDWLYKDKTNVVNKIFGWDLAERMIMEYGIPVPLEIYSFLPFESWKKHYCRQSFYMSCISVDDYTELPFAFRKTRPHPLDWNIYIKHISKIMDFVLLDQAKNCESDNWHLASFLDNFSRFDINLINENDHLLSTYWLNMEGRLKLTYRSLRIVQWLSQNKDSLNLGQETLDELDQLIAIEIHILKELELLLEIYKNQPPDNKLLRKTTDYLIEYFIEYCFEKKKNND